MVKFFQKAARRSGVFKYINFTGLVKIGKARFKIPVIRELGLGNLAATEPWMMELISDLLKKRTGVFVDIGANIGQTLLKLKSVAPECEYIGIEPNPACVYYLRELIKANHFSDCTILPIGLFDEDTMLELLYMGTSEVNSAASVIPDYRPNNKIYSRQYVPVFMCDHILEKVGLEQVVIIKIDVEGAEMEVLQGLKQTLIKQRPFLIVEILPAYHDQNTMRLERQRKIGEFAFELGYSIFRIQKTKDENLASLEKIETIGVHSNLKQCDYLFLPNE